jgi:hypothetical protein
VEARANEGDSNTIRDTAEYFDDTINSKGSIETESMQVRIKYQGPDRQRYWRLYTETITNNRTPSRPTPPVRSSSPDLGVYHLAPPTEGYELEAWKSWCALREVRATDSFNVTKSDHDDWRRHRDNYVSRKLAKETED